MQPLCRYAPEALDRIAKEGYDRFLPVGAPGGPPAKLEGKK
jgi:hypothetical protein